MIREIKNITTNDILLKELGIFLKAGAVIDCALLSLVSCKQNKELFDKINSNQLSFNIDGKKISNSKVKNCLELVTQKGTLSAHWETLQIKNLQKEEEFAITNLIHACLIEQIPLIGNLTGLHCIPMIINDGYIPISFFTSNNIKQISNTFTLNNTSSTTILNTCDSLFGSHETGRKRKGKAWINRNNNYVKLGTTSIALKNYTRLQNQSYGIKYKFSPSNWTNYNEISFWLFGIKDMMLTFFVNNNILLKDMLLIDGWQKIHINLESCFLKKITSYELKFKRKKAPKNSIVYIDQIHQQTNNLFATSGYIESLSKQEKNNIKEIYVNVNAWCPENCTLTTKLSIDDGQNWLIVKENDYMKWLNIKDTVTWTRRNKIKIRIEMTGDSIKTPVLNGYHVLYRME